MNLRNQNDALRYMSAIEISDRTKCQQVEGVKRKVRITSSFSVLERSAALILINAQEKEAMSAIAPKDNNMSTLA